MKKLDLVILAGGVGSRIKRHLSGRPKPMLEFNNKNFLNYVINNFSKYNFNKITTCKVRVQKAKKVLKNSIR